MSNIEEYKKELKYCEKAKETAIKHIKKYRDLIAEEAWKQVQLTKQNATNVTTPHKCTVGDIVTYIGSEAAYHDKTWQVTDVKDVYNVVHVVEVIFDRTTNKIQRPISSYRTTMKISNLKLVRDYKATLNITNQVNNEDKCSCSNPDFKEVPIAGEKYIVCHTCKKEK